MSLLINMVNNLENAVVKIEEGIDILESNLQKRDAKRQSVVIKEVKRILYKMGENDLQQVKDMKAEAYDKTQSIRRILNCLKKTDSEVGSDVMNFKKEIEDLNIIEFVNRLQFSVDVNHSLLTTISEKILDAVYLKSGNINPKRNDLDSE